MKSIRISVLSVLARGNMTTRETILKACKQNPGKTCVSSDSELNEFIMKQSSQREVCIASLDVIF